MILQIPMQRSGPEVEPPARAHETDAGYDLSSAEPVVLAPTERALVSTGIAVAIPEGYCGLILPRSGLAIKHGVTVLNAPGLIDSGYRGEIQVALVNLGHEMFVAHRNTRIAQLVIVKCEVASFHTAVSLVETDRGSNGFGSTGS